MPRVGEYAGVHPAGNVGDKPCRKLAAILAHAPPEVDLPRSYRIALIEGDSLMRELAERWVRGAGHEVIPLTARQFGLGTRADLLMVDVAHLRGATERVQALRANHPAPVLLVSGRLRRGSAPSAALAQQLGAAAVLPKPYSRAQLLAAVAVALGALP